VGAAGSDADTTASFPNRPRSAIIGRKEGHNLSDGLLGVGSAPPADGARPRPRRASVAAGGRRVQAPAHASLDGP
jgi:hypothetical protein